jgi:hypothetical protein
MASSGLRTLALLVRALLKGTMRLGLARSCEARRGHDDIRAETSLIDRSLLF